MPLMKSNALKLYSDVQGTKVEWLWYPYIPYGKITLLQGDPGEGKSTMMMDLIARISRGGAFPDGSGSFTAQRVIYQCSEDGAADTIKPRLEACKANCRNVAFLDEELVSLTLSDEHIRDAIDEFKARLLVIDPFQAYVLNDADISSAVKARKIMQKLSSWAATYRCAVVLIGHLNKGSSGNEIYRSLGSIDVAACARSIIQVSRDKDDPDTRILHHVKSNLAKLAEDSTFEIDGEHRVHWITLAGNPQGKDTDAAIIDSFHLTSEKQELVAKIILQKLKDGPVRATEMDRLFESCDVSTKTIHKTKASLGVKSVRKDGQWFWHLPEK